MELDNTQSAVLRELSRGFPDGIHPYREIAERCGVSEPQVLDAIGSLLDAGIIRRMAAIVHDAKLGYEGNAMVAWQVADADLEQAGSNFAQRPEISHAYARKTTNTWHYNLYTMIHAKTRDDSKRLVEELASEIGAAEYKILYSIRELTKRPPAYGLILGTDEADTDSGSA